MRKSSLYMRPERTTELPLLVLCDLASEEYSQFTTEDGRLIGRLAFVINIAREIGLEIAYCERHIFRSKGWPTELANCRPKPFEMIFERDSASCFANLDFKKLAVKYRRRGILFAGLGSYKGILASALDAESLNISTKVITDLCGGEARDNTEAILYGMVIIVQILSMDVESSFILALQPR